MVDYEEYIKQCWELLSLHNTNIDVSTKEFEDFYKIYTGDFIENEQEILNKISNFISEYPIKFLDTPLGQVWGCLKFQDNYITVAEAAALLNVSVQYIKQSVVTKIKTRKSCKIVLLSEKSLEEWLIKRKKPTLNQLKKERSNALSEQ